MIDLSIADVEYLNTMSVLNRKDALSSGWYTKLLNNERNKRKNKIKGGT